MSISNVNNYFDGAAPKCPYCSGETILQTEKNEIGKYLYRYTCPACSIFAPPAINREKAAKNFEELAKQYKPPEILCRNCEHYKPIEKYTGHCILHNLPAHETGTCREGKKKDSGQTLLDLKDGGKGGGIAIGKLAQPLEAGTDLNEISAAGVYAVDTAKKPDCTAILFKETETEALTKAIEYMRAQGYIVEKTKTGFIVKGKAAGG